MLKDIIRLAWDFFFKLYLAFTIVIAFIKYSQLKKRLSHRGVAFLFFRLLSNRVKVGAVL